MLLLADAHPVFRYGLTAILTGAGFEVGQEITDPSDLSHMGGDFAVAICDVSFMAVIHSRILNEGWGTKTICLAGALDTQHVYRMFAKGVDGYLLKRVGPEVIVEAVNTVLAGENFLGPNIQRSLVNEIHAHSHLDPPGLTVREIEVLRAVSEGASTKEIADRLVIAPETVKTHARNIREKLEVPNLAAAVGVGYRLKLL